MSTVGLDQILEQRVSDCLDRAISEERLVGGVVLVAKNGDIVVEIAAGLADREAGRKMREDAIFRYSSFTKTIVAAATMALVERGVIQLDDPVTQIGALRITTTERPAWGFGFGGAVLVDSALAGTPQPMGTWNWGGIYGHHWYVDPVNRLTVVAMTNTSLEGMVGRFVDELRAAVYGGR